MIAARRRFAGASQRRIGRSGIGAVSARAILRANRVELRIRGENGVVADQRRFGQIDAEVERGGPTRTVRRVRQAPQLFAKLAVAFLRRIECGKPRAGVRRGGGFGERRVGSGDARGGADQRRDARRGDPRPACLFGVSDDRRGDRHLGFGEFIRLEAGRDPLWQGEAREAQAVLDGAVELRKRCAPGARQAVGADPDGLESARRVEGANRSSGSAPVAVPKRIGRIADNQSSRRRCDRRRDWGRDWTGASRRRRRRRRRFDRRRGASFGGARDDAPGRRVRRRQRGECAEVGRTERRLRLAERIKQRTAFNFAGDRRALGRNRERRNAAREPRFEQRGLRLGGGCDREPRGEKSAH